MMEFESEIVNNSIPMLIDQCTQMEKTRDFAIARKALWHLMIFKVLIGFDRFNSLPEFVRYMGIACEIVNEHDKELIEK